MPTPRRILMLVPAALVGASPAMAQRIVLTPLLGAYAPTSNLVEAVDGPGEVRQASGIAGGLQMLVRFGAGRAGFETSLMMSRSGLGSSLPSTLPPTSDTLATVYLLGAKGRLFLTPLDGRHTLSVAAGVALASRNGTVADRVLTGTTRTTAVLGVSYGLALGEGVDVAVSVEDYIYPASVREPSSQRGPTQHDLFIGIGFALTVWDRR